MSGGIAYVLDVDGDFKRALQPRHGGSRVRSTQAEDIELVRELIRRHVDGHRVDLRPGHPRRLVDVQPRFVKVMPRDYKRVLAAEAHARTEGREPTFAELVGTTSG